MHLTILPYFLVKLWKKFKIPFWNLLNNKVIYNSDPNSHDEKKCRKPFFLLKYELKSNEFLAAFKEAYTGKSSNSFQWSSTININFINDSHFYCQHSLTNIKFLCKVKFKVKFKIKVLVAKYKLQLLLETNVFQVF